MRRARVFVVVALAAAAAATLAFGSSEKVKTPVAFLHIDARLSCAKASTCKFLPPWMASLRNPMDITLYADGTLYYEARVITVGRSGPQRCDKTLFDRPFTGKCNVFDYGVGYLKKTSIPGPYKGLDVWVTSETARIGASQKLQVNPFGPYPLDTANPAVAGHYSIEKLVPVKDINADETLTVDVTRTPAP